MKWTKQRSTDEVRQNLFMKWTKQRSTDEVREEKPRVLIRHLIMLKTNILYDSLSAMNVVYYSSCTFRSSEFICVAAVEALRKKERQDEN